MKIYVASSWRNKQQPEVVSKLRAEGHKVYDFRNPEEGNHGFSWSEIDSHWKEWTKEQYIENLFNPIATEGYMADLSAMTLADACVMVMPCGRSAHLEAGYFTGANKTLVILIDDSEPELMYRLADKICITIEEVIEYLGSP